MTLVSKVVTRRLAFVLISLISIQLVTLSITYVPSKAHAQDILTYFKKPVAVAVDSKGNVFVADVDKNQVLKFTGDGKLLKAWGGFGTDPGKFDKPNGVAVDSSDNIYVSDGQNHRIQKFSNTGTHLDGWGSYCDIQTGTNCKDLDGAGSLSKGDGQFHYPREVTVDKYNRVYVVDSFNSRIQVFSIDGKFLGKWGTQGSGDGQFKFPTDITIDSMGYAYVVDRENSRVQKFVPPVIVPNKPTIFGVFLAKWGSGTFNNPIGIDHDLSNSLYITNSDNNRVLKLTKEGSVIGHWGAPNNAPGTGNGEFNKPYGIALNPSGTNVFVADTGNQRIQKFTNSGDFITKWGPSRPLIVIP